ncbi:Glucose dehydrogenase/choline dehydrogenase/mandelonitrile lyase (GMC oxidoreductase family) [Handroanthus impetiginosus]|uniref:Long-chain-alcohol oxidase n=1 Tax=Handroanthus impetiginosus TaxID=429701 RepID=A0A2G9I9H2_9LAMI|nr:Glucose dehydrogenase/choline dehydrogenase/mandelonitrile lyase (GMC oxidoreductase family) [Handroanthus impetiginosus]
MAAKKNVKKGPYSEGQMEALSALCDTLLPSIDVSDDLDDDSVVQFYRASASMAGTPQRLAILLGEKIQHPKSYLSRLALWLLSTWFGTFILCGTKSLSGQFPYFQRFSQISLERRAQILLSWSDSCFSLFRLLYTATKIFTLLVFFTQVNDEGGNVSWRAIGYHRPDLTARKPAIENAHQSGDETPDRQDCASDKEQFGPLHKGIIKLNKSKEMALHKLQKLGFPISRQHSKKMKIKSLKPSFIIKCDAVVVGSGSGGGVVAGVLAEAGYKVLVLEKGSYLARKNLSLLEGEAMDQMYLGHGILGTENMDILLLAGSTVGGGSTINWSASIRTPPHVIKDWSENYNLEFFDSKVYQKALDVVCEKMGVQMEIEDEGFNNMILRKGCENLGYPVETIPRNAPSDHYCGWCSLGCRDGRKNSVSETWLVDLVESGNGAILTGCEVIKVVMDQEKGRKRATGVAFLFKDEGVEETVIVESEVTIVSCGAICTPPLLKRSGLKNPNIGRNLHLHPVVLAWGYFPDTPDGWPEAEKRSYEGAIMTAMSKTGSNLEPFNYGGIIQTPSLHPGMFSALMPWRSGRDIKNRLLKFSRTAHIFALARDKGSGVVNSPTDISYKMVDSDQENLCEGFEKVLRILAAAGAEEIGTFHKKGRVLSVKQADKEEFERFVKEESLRPLKKLSSPICSAHQMGSCRMGVAPKGSVVSPKGETWEVEGLYIADSSVFPTALGVNPMVTVQAIAYCVGQSVLEYLGGKKKLI